MPIIFHRLAMHEFIASRRWYARRSMQVEARFVAAIGSALRTIEANPNLGAPFAGIIRWHRVRRFPFVIYFEPVTAQTIHVYAIAHSRRRQGYWLRRVTRP